MAGTEKKTTIEHLDALIKFYQNIETSDERLKKLIIRSLKDVRRRAENEKKYNNIKLDIRRGNGKSLESAFKLYSKIKRTSRT